VGLSTNATLLTEERSIHILKTSLDFLSFSFDGCTPEVYEKVRVGANFEQVKSQIETFLRLRSQMRRKKPHTKIEIIFMKETYQHTSQFIKYWQTKAVDRVGIRPVSTWCGLVDSHSVFRGLTVPTYGYGHRPCRDIFYKCAILVDGTVVPCCGDFEGGLPMGNIFTQPFNEIWNGDLYSQLRAQHLYNTLPENSICHRCGSSGCWSRREQIFVLIFNKLIRFCRFLDEFPHQIKWEST